MKKSMKIFVVVTVIGVTALAAGLAVLIWWLVAGRHEVTTNILLDGEGLGGVRQTAAITQIGREGDLFWWFYPTVATAGAAQPLILWLEGATGLPPSLFANFGMFGPLDFNLNNRTNSWINQYNLLFVDAPLGTGFSRARTDDTIPQSLDENIDHLIHVLKAFYAHHEDYQNAPLYIFGSGHGAQLALSLAIRLTDLEDVSHNLQGLSLMNGIVSPAVALTKLGFYLEEMGYIDATGRSVIEDFSREINNLVASEDYEAAYDKFLTLGKLINEEAGTVAINLGRIIDKLTKNEEVADYFGETLNVQTILGDDVDLQDFLGETIVPSLRLSTIEYDSQRRAAVRAFRSSFMVPSVDKVEYILNNTNHSVAVCNGNLDAVSTTPGQLEWINSLNWFGQAEFIEQARQTLVVNNLVQGYFKETDRLKFYWVNAAGQSTPFDSPDAIRSIVQRIVD